MRSKIIVITVLLLLSVVVGVQAGQQDNGIAAVKTADGFLLIWNQPNNYFTLKITGKNVRPVDSSDQVFFDIDGTVFQAQVADTGQFLNPATKTGRDNVSVLAAHRDWESEYVEKALGQKARIQSSPLKLKSGRDVLLWQYDMPEGLSNGDARKQLYLTVVRGESVLVLNGVVNDKNSEQTVRQLLLSTLETLKESTQPINVKEEQEKIRRGVQ